MQRICTQLLLGLLATASLPAQAAPRARQSGPPASLARAQACGVTAFGGAVTAVGPGYRAVITPHGATFQPALGKAAPAAATVHFSTAALRRGDRRLGRPTAMLPTLTHDRRSATLHRPLVDERYEARVDGLKQSFLFAERPAGTGPLCVALTVTATLPPTASDAPVAWLDAHGNGVVLGDVLGIDARGSVVRGAARHTATGIELELPGWFVDAAQYPLELDPLLGPALPALANVDADFPDVAYEGWSDSYCVVWTQFYGGGQTGIVGSVWDATTLGFGYAFAINQPGDEDFARVTSIGGPGVFAILWVNYAAAGASLCGLAFDPGQAQSTPVFTLYGPGGVGAPVVSGEATGFDDDCLVAWLDDTYGLLGCTLAIDPSLQPSASPVLQIAGGSVSEPAFSKQGGVAGLHLLTWVDRPIGQPGWIRAQVVDDDFNLRGPAAWLRSGPQDCGYPSVDGDGFRFLATWQEQELQHPAATDVRGRLVTVGPNGITSLGGVLDLAARPGEVDCAADVAMLGDKFGLCWMQATAAAPFDDDCLFRVFSAHGAPIGAELRLDVNLGSSYRYEHAPRLIGRRAGDPQTNADDGLVVFADQSVTTFDSDVGLQAVAAMGAGGAIVDRGGGCGPGGLAVTGGPFALGNVAFRCELYGADPLAIPFLLLAPAAPAVGCGVCQLVQPLVAHFVANTAGSASWSLAVPGDPALVGYQLDFQFAGFNVLYVGCPALPGMAASNIVRATLGM